MLQNIYIADVCIHQRTCMSLYILEVYIAGVCIHQCMTICVHVLLSDVNTSLRQAGSGPIPGTKLGEYKAVSLYKDIMKNTDEIPTILSAKQDVSRAKRMKLHFDALISLEEKKKLLSKQHDEGDKELILEHLNHLVVAQFVHAHCRKTPAAKSKEDMRKLVPPGLSRKFQGTNDLMVCVCVVTLIFALVLLCMF